MFFGLGEKIGQVWALFYKTMKFDSSGMSIPRRHH
jgi:hypothetical protein